VDSLSFERGEETFHHRVIVTIPRSTHAAYNALISEKFLEIVAWHTSLRIFALFRCVHNFGVRPTRTAISYVVLQFFSLPMIRSVNVRFWPNADMSVTDPKRTFS
jgi:hypothetical protein